mmetsp:Transcript_2882/g.5172  ORF Transcript_2882/g.5172 Transcript_2882/m.5172 type:complete len:236 (-) Transcript_2882:353-1060(-)
MGAHILERQGRLFLVRPRNYEGSMGVRGGQSSEQGRGAVGAVQRPRRERGQQRRHDVVLPRPFNGAHAAGGPREPQHGGRVHGVRPGRVYPRHQNQEGLEGGEREEAVLGFVADAHVARRGGGGDPVLHGGPVLEPALNVGLQRHHAVPHVPHHHDAVPPLLQPLGQEPDVGSGDGDGPALPHRHLHQLPDRLLCDRHGAGGVRLPKSGGPLSALVALLGRGVRDSVWFVRHAAL